MVDVRAGHHGDVGYTFEDAGYDTEPNDTDVKVFGSNASYQAVRVYNASRTAAEIIEQNFDGGWGVTFELSEPPWWLAGVFGQPSSTNVSGALYDYTYDLSNGNDPVPLRLYAPTDGYNDYKVIPGAYIVSISVDQGEGGQPEINLTGGYARQPFEDNTLSISIPDFGESSLTNRDAELQVDGSTVGKSQNTNLNLETNTDGISEIGTGNMVDFSPKAFTPDVTYDKILWVGETVDVFSRFTGGNQVNVNLLYDNGESGEDEYSLDWQITDSFPNSWSESGRNDPDADLMNELQEMGETAVVTATTDAGDSGSPPGITL